MANKKLSVMAHKNSYSETTTYTINADNYLSSEHGVALSAVFHLDQDQAEALILDLQIAMGLVPTEATA